MSGAGLGRFPSLERAAVVTAVALILGAAASSAQAEPRHGLSAFGDLKYPANFTHFDYVNPDAPKGGRLARVGTRGLTTFNSFNGYILKGDAAQGLSLFFEGFSLIFDSLMTRAHDEPDAVYGLIAETANLAEDRRSVTFRLRPEAAFADGTPVTAEDVKFSFDVLKSDGHPVLRSLLRDVSEAEVLGPHAIVYRFKGNQLRDLPLTVATLPVFSKAYYADKEFDETTLEPPLGSGPYEVTDFQQGRFVTYQRRADYWGRDLPVNRGRWNFDTVRFEYFRDRTAELEALKAGTYDLREEFTSKDWATAYDIPQVRDGRMVLTTLKDERPSGAQGFLINTRRAKFSDPRVRKALDYAFDFEWTNKNLFYELYTRTASYFENSPMKAEGPPSAAELELLGPFREQLPKSVFEAPYSPPVSDGSGTDRKLLREALRLLGQTSFKRQGRNWVGPDGKPLSIEFLTFSPTIDRIIQPYVQNLANVGIAATIRRVDPAQFERRVKSFDFDIVVRRFVMGATPGPGIRSYMASDFADVEGSQNLAGIRSPVVDALLDKIVEADNRTELNVSARALDRVLRAGHYWVPHWYKAAHNIAHWNRFSRPDTKPKYADGVIDTWWFDAEKAKQADQ